MTPSPRVGSDGSDRQVSSRRSLSGLSGEYHTWLVPVQVPFESAVLLAPPLKKPLRRFKVDFLTINLRPAFAHDLRE